MNDVTGWDPRTVHRMFRYVAALLCLFCSFVPSAVLALTDTFVVRSLIGSDTTPPTVPSPFSATSVATTQIDLVWGTSTDDILLSGYYVYRNDVRIATTSSLIFSDTGLTPSTTYTYYVTAFDSFFNESASSSAVSATTYAPIVTSTEGDDGRIYGSVARPEIILRSLVVTPGVNNVRIEYETNAPVRGIVRWGRTSSYELGSSAEHSFTKIHSLTIDSLLSDTEYQFTVEGETGWGESVSLRTGRIRTLPEFDVFPPGVIRGLTLIPFSNDIQVSWENSSDADFHHVRVVRSYLWYPSNERDGWVVYEGNKNEVIDQDVLIRGQRVYYSVFAYDNEGNMSAPAVASFQSSGVDDGTIDDPLATNTIDLRFETLEFYQDSQRIPVVEGGVHIDGARHVTVAIPYIAVPEHLKTILVRIIPEHDTKKVLSFILRINQEKTAYTARLAPFGISGTFRITTSVFDFETKYIGYVQGRLDVFLGSREVMSDRKREKGSQSQSELAVIVCIGVLLLLLYWIGLLLHTNRRKDHLL